VVAAPEVGLCGRGLASGPDEDDVAEDDRKRTDVLTEVRAVLYVEVQVRHQRVARVPDSGDLLAEPHALSLAHPSASLLEVREHCVAPTANIEEDVVAGRGVLPDVADGLVGWRSVTLTTMPSAGDSTGSPKPYQDVYRFGSPSWPRPSSSSCTKSTALLTMGVW
jgi:hypothetical protein